MGATVASAQRGCDRRWLQSRPYTDTADAAGDAAAVEAIDRLWAIRDRIYLTPTRTPAGIAAQIRIAIATTDDGSILSEEKEEGLRNAVRSIERLAGRA